MSEFLNNAYFWQKIDTLYYSSHMEVVCKKGTSHQRYKNLVYPLDYAYLTDTLSESGHGIAVFLGSGAETITTMVIAADILKKDVEIKLLVGCTPDEERAVLEFLNQTDYQKTILVRRGREIPSWAISN